MEDDFEFDEVGQEGEEVEEESTKHAKRSKRLRHKVGVASYADLITKAILSKRDARLSLAEIYDWMASNVPGLEAQRYLHSSKGWKNAVRHTLSVNPRFHKVVRMGRPSWWTLDDEALKSAVESTSGRSVDNVNFELKSFRSRCGSEPAYSLTTLSKLRDAKNSARRGTIGEGCDDDEVQQIKVWRDDGTVAVVTVPAPLHLKQTVSEEISTQTDDLGCYDNSNVAAGKIDEPQIDQQPQQQLQQLGNDNASFGPACTTLPDKSAGTAFTAELAPSLCEDTFQCLTTLEDWEQLPIFQQPTYNDEFLSSWLGGNSFIQ